MGSVLTKIARHKLHTAFHKLRDTNCALCSHKQLKHKLHSVSTQTALTQTAHCAHTNYRNINYTLSSHKLLYLENLTLHCCYGIGTLKGLHGVLD